MIDTLVDWLTKEINESGMSMREVGRRAGLSHAAISAVLAGHANPGLDFCVGVARAFNLPPEHILRMAGLIPASPSPYPITGEIKDILTHLPETERQDILEYARLRYRLFRERREVYSTE